MLLGRILIYIANIPSTTDLPTLTMLQIEKKFQIFEILTKYSQQINIHLVKTFLEI